MIKKRRKPDFMFVLAVIVALGVIFTMKGQASSSQPIQSASSNVKPEMMQTVIK